MHSNSIHEPGTQAKISEGRPSYVYIWLIEIPSKIFAGHDLPKQVAKRLRSRLPAPDFQIYIGSLEYARTDVDAGVAA